MNGTQQASTSVLCWPKRLFSADDLRRHLTSQNELLLLPKTIITPLAADELRAKGIRISWQVPKPKDTAPLKQAAWSYAQEKPEPLITSAIQALNRDGISLLALEVTGPTATWARSIAESILRAGHCGGVVFCSDPALVSCIANKISGLRAVAVCNLPQLTRARKHLGANLFAIEMPGRTFYELRQMLRTIVTDDAACPVEVANLLQELDGHAHR